MESEAKLDKIKKSLRTFCFQHPPSLALPILRIALAAVLIAQASQLMPHLFTFYGEFGFVQQSLSSYLGTHWIPQISWFTNWLRPLGWEDEQIVTLLFACYIASLLCLALGFLSRASATSAWLLHFMILNSNNLSNYGVDHFAHVFLFYLSVFPASSRLALDQRIWPKKRDPIYSSIALRCFQLHMCVVYFFAGAGKALGPQWWNGESIWRAMMLPEYQQFDFSWLVHMPWLAMTLGIGTIIIEICYPIFIWHHKTRLPWALGIVALHIGIIIFQGLHFFGLTMLLLTFAAFIVPHLEFRALNHHQN